MTSVSGRTSSSRSSKYCQASIPDYVGNSGSIGGGAVPRRVYQTRHKTSISRLFKRDAPSNLDSPMQFSGDDVVMEGVLTKLSTSKYFSSKPCYCILRSDTWSLCQYKSQSDLILLGEIVLSQHDIVRDVSDCESMGPVVHKFELLRPVANQCVHFATPTIRSLEQWICALETAIFELSQLGKPALPHPPQPELSIGTSGSRSSRSPKKATATDDSGGRLAQSNEDSMTAAFAAATMLEDELRNEPMCGDVDDNDCNNNYDNDSNAFPETHEDNNNDDDAGDNQDFGDDDESKPAYPGASSHSDLVGASPTCFSSRQSSPEKLRTRQTTSLLGDRFFRKVPRVAPGLSSTAVRAVHSFSASGQVFTLDVKYKLIKPIGTGAYGAVISATNDESGESVAIKKISNIFDDLVDAKRILRETRLLGHFNHKNITRLLDLLPPPSRAAFDDMYIIAELMETDLHQVIYSMQPMSDDHVKYFLYQILCALHHIHSAGVIHRDMKPSNILLNSNCDLKICDFGLARGGFPENIELTEYVVTRWYRAPEIMLNCLQYTEAVDMWAVGCILAEMIQREPLFPGNDYIHQLKLIIKFMGTPKVDEVEFVKNAKAQRFLTKLPIYKPSKFEDVFPAANEQAIDLLRQMLVFNPAKRISVLDALHHPYLEAFFDAADLVVSPPFDFGFDIPDDKLTRDALVSLLMEDIATFHPELDLTENAYLPGPSAFLPPPPPPSRSPPSSSAGNVAAATVNEA
ncbi:CMGC/MAPK protein kinase [Aphanomyces invadans]|uniref:Mitogen-activated protein kinase n=1 Tax=Aphanomyces invadans TaxID=157072 RepID=A0A024TMN7_9STRA|nr:CMGC/MAPK protein kinase [Aphanomyces invadans]ETV95269.1 CMGC/MAPK protein kinase [Aphanomyces invadans]|eukprot:XP_008875970.1 CMGC/MAPK protein kinase [Aphanomyces invadans]